jgi:hypothetical protein
MRFDLLLFCCFAPRYVTPGPNDLQWFVVDSKDQTLFVVHPAIRAILAAKTILHRVNPIPKEFGYSLLYAGKIVGMDAIAPEGQVTKVLRWHIAEYVEDIVADKERCIITGSPEAVDHSG